MAWLFGLSATWRSQHWPPGYVFQSARRTRSNPTQRRLFSTTSGYSMARARRCPSRRMCLVRGNVIERISEAPIATDRMATTTIIAGGGRTLMPGLIDNHWHAALARITPAQSLGDVTYSSLHAGVEATDTLMRGFTTVRDLGGPVFGLKTRHRRGRTARPAHLSFGRRDHRHERAWGFQTTHRSAAHARRHAPPHGAAWWEHGRGQPRRGTRAHARTTHAGRLPDQIDGGRRCVVTLQPGRRGHLYRGRTARRGGSG